MRKTIIKKTTIKRAAAVILAGAMCFGVINMGQDVTAEQNMRSDPDGIKDSLNRINVSSRTENGSEGTFTVTGDAAAEYVYFGSYPQSEITGDELTEDIINAQYVSGTAVVDGEKYCRITPEDADYTIYEYANNSLKDNHGLKYASEAEREKYRKQEIARMQPYMYNWGTENYHYFKYEPIKWRVKSRDGDKLEVCAACILDTRRYWWYNETPYAGMLRNEGWRSSALRRWLNSEPDGFLNRAFNVEEQEVIQTLETEIMGEMYDGEKWNRYVKIEIKDKVKLGRGTYVDSKYEVLPVSDYAFAMGTRSYSKSNRISRIWTDTVVFTGSGNDGFASYIDEYGYHHTDSLTIPLATRKYYYVEYSHVKGYGVVPAIVIQLDKLENLTGSQEPAVSEPVHAEYPKGDVNGDFTVDLGDARLALKSALNLVKLDEEQKKRAAVTTQNAHTITLRDAQLILRLALNLG